MITNIDWLEKDESEFWAALTGGLLLYHAGRKLLIFCSCKQSAAWNMPNLPGCLSLHRSTVENFKTNLYLRPHTFPFVFGTQLASKAVNSYTQQIEAFSVTFAGLSFGRQLLFFHISDCLYLCVLTPYSCSRWDYPSQQANPVNTEAHHLINTPMVRH